MRCANAWAVGTLLISAILFSDVCVGETLDDLKGLSIHAAWTQHIIGHTPPDNRLFNVHPRTELRLYVSLRGNIFEYNHVAGGPDNSAVKDSRKIFQVDRATEHNPGLLTVWTMRDGHLAKITQHLAGFGISTLSVDSARMTCSLDHQILPDKETNMIWVISPISNKPTQLHSHNVDNIICTVKRGNIFA